MSRTTVCITGAGGFVGSALAEGFAALGWSVTAVDRAFDDGARARLAGTDLTSADLAAGAPADLPEARVVIHAAAMTTDPTALGWTPAEHVAANIRPLLAMLEYAARARPEAFVFLSSSGVFAPGDGEDGLRDTDTPTARSPYAAAKRAGELLVHAALEGLAATHVVRLGYLYGPHEAARPTRARVSLVARWMSDAREGRPLPVSADDPLRDWTFSEDLAPALARLVEEPGRGRPVHLCSPHVMRDSAMAALVAGHVTGATIRTVPAPAATKAPMRASRIAALDSFAWTTPEAGIARLAATQVAA